MFLLAALAALLGAQEITTDELIKLHDRNDGTVFLDVREPHELEELGTLRGYVNIPVKQLEKRMSELPKDKLIVPFCKRGVRAATAAELLKKNGYRVAGSAGFTELREREPKRIVYPKPQPPKQ